MKIFQALCLVGAVSAQVAFGQTVPEYRNTGIVNTPINIDALNFINLGEFNLANDGEVFRTFNTLNFTNRGVIDAPSFSFNQGIQFATVGGSSVTNARSFVNQGEIYLGDGTDEFVIELDGDGNPVGIPYFRQAWTKIDVWAANILNNGLMDLGITGEIKLTGSELNLRRSGLRTGVNRNFGVIDSDTLLFDDDGNLLYYLNPSRVYDLYWGAGTNSVLFDIEDRGFPLDLANSGFDLPNPGTPQHEVFLDDPANAPNATTAFTSLPGFLSNTSYEAFVFEQDQGTNSAASIVFVPSELEDGEIVSEVSFSTAGPSVIIPTVTFQYTDRDPVLGRDITNSISITDQLMATSASDSGTSTGENILELGWRPENYRLTRGNFGITGGGGNADFDFATHIWDDSQPQFVTNNYAAYSISIDDEPEIVTLIGVNDFLDSGFIVVDSRADAAFGFGSGNVALYDPANRGGRVVINASGNLNMEKTRVRGQYYASVKADQGFKYDADSLIDAPVVSLDLTSTNGLLQLENLVPDTVRRLSGTIDMYSTVWSNALPVIVQGDDGPETNFINQVRHVFFLDPSQIETIQSVTIDNLTLRATNIVLNNNFISTGPLLLDAERVTLNSNLFVGDFLEELGTTDSVRDVNMPRLKEFEISSTGLMGVLHSLSIGHGSQSGQVESIKLNGRVVAKTLDFAADEIDASGGVIVTEAISGGPIRFTANSLDLTLVGLLGNGDVFLTADQLIMPTSQIAAGGVFRVAGGQELGIGRLYLAISEVLNDGGTGAGALIQVTDGVEMLMKPQSGDLLGTTVESVARRFREVSHVWGGEDRGASEAGFLNNAAIGTLQLSGGEFSLFTFEAPGGDNALYVDSLVLNGYTLDNFEDGVEIRPGMKVYFARVFGNMPFGGLTELDPADYDGLLQGRLIHVPRPTTEEEFYTNASGQQIRVTSALLYSPTLDSDGDGILNAYDSDPLGGVVVEVERVVGDNPVTLVKWNGAARTNYRVEYKDSIDAEGWNLLTSVTTNMRAKQVVVEDDSVNSGLRIYRVLYLP